MSKYSTQFELEQAIMNAWNTKDDIDILYRTYMDGEHMSTDDVANTLIGISQLHQMKMSRVFELFEQLLKEQKDQRDVVRREGVRL